MPKLSPTGLAAAGQSIAAASPLNTDLREIWFPRPIDEAFANFDRKLIGSASVACVYQAYLPNGDRVEVKLCRPNIGVRLAADCGALAAVLRLREIDLLPRNPRWDA